MKLALNDLIMGFALGVVLALGFIVLTQLFEIHVSPAGYFRGPFG